MTTTSPKVLKLWIRSQERQPPVECDELTISEQGVVGDHTHGRMRHVTLLFVDDWSAAAAELGKEVDPVGRRANVLLSGGGTLAYLGATIQLGEVEIEIRGVTEPCPVMDQAAPGMMKALKPDARAGIWGRIQRAGVIRSGDALQIVDSGAADS